MVVKIKENPIEKIREIILSQNGILLTSDLKKYNIPRTYLSLLVKKGEVQRISKGVYVSANNMPDEMYLLQTRYKGAIFSHETASYLHDLSDRTPLFYTVTVPSGYNATSLKKDGAKVYFINKRLLTLGCTIVKSPYGNDIKTYDTERTICDILRNRNQIDIQIVNEALKRYIRRDDKDLNKLYAYASLLRVQKIVREYIDVLL